MIPLKRFLSERRMRNVKRNENRKARKNRRKRSKKKFGTVWAKEKKSPNFGICTCTKVKYCTLLHGISIKMLLQCEKVVLIANFRES